MIETAHVCTAAKHVQLLTTWLAIKSVDMHPFKWKTDWMSTFHTGEPAWNQPLRDVDATCLVATHVLETTGNDPRIVAPRTSRLENACMMGMQESMRLWSVAPGSTRCLEKAACIGGYDIAAGTLVQVSFHGIHRIPAVWDRPDECLPVCSCM